jgi:hypothetical protein
VGDGVGLATDFVTDLTDVLVGDGVGLAADFVTDLTDGFLLRKKICSFPVGCADRSGTQHG